MTILSNSQASRLPPSEGYAPLLSPKFIWRAAAVLVAIAVLTALINVGGRLLGERIADAGHTADTRKHTIVIGADTLALPANAIRFASQRIDGPQPSVDLYLRWPEMEGYTSAARDVFNGTVADEPLVFLSLSRQIMSQDMSGRYAPIYSKLVSQSGVPGPGGLLEYDLGETSGYVGERLYVEDGGDDRPYVVRCLADGAAQAVALTSTACQRDILVGNNTAVLYRFSPSLLPQWRRIEADMRGYLEAALAGRK